MLDDLTAELKQQQGAVLTAEGCARLMAAALWTGPQEDAPLSKSGRVILARRDVWFQEAGGLMGGWFSPMSGHQLLVMLGSDGQARAFVAFTRIAAGQHAEVSIWADQDRGLAGRDFVQEVFRHAWETLGLKTLLVLVAHDNAKSIACVEALGFTQTGIIPAWFKTGDAAVYTITPDTCPW